MGSRTNVKTRTNIVSTEASVTILRGQAATAWGTRATSHIGVVGVAEDDIPPGAAGAAVTGRVWTKFSATPATNAELTVDANGDLAAAVATNVVLGYQLEPTRVDYPALGIAWVEPGPYVKA